MTGVVLAGGGLAGSLIAWRLAQLRPEVPLLLLERGAALGGNHTWSFHGSDLEPAQLEWVRPLVAYAWDAQTVRFPDYERRLGTPYYSITSGRLHDVVTAALGARARLNCDIADVAPDGVRLASGELVAGALVIDGRGAPPIRGFDLAWQKFLGMEVDLARPHGLEAPVLMDATVAQLDGYRFVYLLPLGPRRLLIEDTCYSDSPDLRVEELRGRVRDYAIARGFDIAGVVREETGVLPIVLDGDVARFWEEAGVAVPRAGMRAMLFHHTTGYSLPDAVRLADQIAAMPELASAPVAAGIREIALRRWREQRFFRLLNRLMFRAAAPEERYRTLQHFYRLPEPLINRFYAGRPDALDALRVLSGKPPVPVLQALRVMAGGAGRRDAGSDAVPRRRNA